MANRKSFWVSQLGAVLILFMVASAKPASAEAGRSISVSPRTAAPSTSVSTTGSGFPSRAKGKIFFGDEVVATFTTSRSGRFSKQWTVPEEATSGKVLAKASSRKASTPLEVQTAPPDDGQQRWSNPATWDSEVPGEGDSVTIPADKTVLLDASPPALKSLQIDGTLIFEDRDLELKADWIVVHGKLQVGTEATPFRHKASISLTGTNKTENVMNMGTKVLGVMGGTLELHGETRPGWTRLAQTAEKGSSTLTLESALNWRPGDRIVVASTDYWADQSEEVVIKSISGSTVTLESALRYQHWGSSQSYAGETVDERGEVGLLSRNVVIEGEETSSADGFGGQIMVMNGGQARLEGVELNRMGQKNFLRRYPIHLHMLGDAPDSYVKSSVVHHAFNRCLVVHGTNRLAIEGNVCHDHIGHGYFLEDGAETGNAFEGNLGLRTREPEDGERLLPSDSSPATFWITNPNNVFRNNAAAGSDGVGFWYALPEHPMGLSKTDAVWPRRTSLGEFSSNVAHSNGDQGLNVDDGPKPDGTTESTWYSPRSNPTDGRSTPVVASFENLTAYKNRDHGVWLRGENQLVNEATLADNRAGATFAAEETFLEDSLVVGETANKGNPKSWETKGLDGRSLPFFWAPETPITGFEFYDGRVGARRVAFAEFNTNSQRPSGGLGYLEPNAFSIHPQNFAEAVSFYNANPVYLSDPEAGYDGDNSKVFVDKDGSVTGTAGRTVVVRNPFLLNDNCESETDWNAHVCEADYASLCFETLVGDPQAIKPLTLERDDGETQTLMGSEEDSSVAISSVLPDQNYETAFNSDTPSKARFVLWRGKDRWVRLSVDYPSASKVTKYGCGLDDPNDWCEGKAGSLSELDASTSSAYYYDAEAKKLYLKIVSEGYDWEELEVQPGS